ncbi:reverse transcriptase [Phytophthora megakarya]|uniref:Reverse transcriptase n=1 Tax=Phytophthora megakarya TaxID=4795 RepID=A0A225VNP7_9STRA|nr:reverse transcriptase [Phytophthora megakarya]
MSDFFRLSNKILGQRQRAMMTYRPQANETAENMVQLEIRALTMYVRDLKLKDWDEHAECPTFTTNTPHDRKHFIIWYTDGTQDQRWWPQFSSDAQGGTIGTRDGGATSSNGIINSHRNQLTADCEK